MTVRIDTKGRDFIAGGKVYTADSEGFVEVPKKVAVDEGHIAPDPVLTGSGFMIAGDDDADGDQNPDTGNSPPWKA